MTMLLFLMRGSLVVFMLTFKSTMHRCCPAINYERRMNANGMDDVLWVVIQLSVCFIYLPSTDGKLLYPSSQKTFTKTS